jgi:dolichol-phosphate mannosyltransferase
VQSQADYALEITVIVPTYNERANVSLLVNAVRLALHPYNWELLFVDDSIDGTDDLIRRFAATDSRIRLLHRPKPIDGLSGAVLEGFTLSGGAYCCVIDGDLQHPPDLIPALLEKAKRDNCEVVVASRYLPGAGTAGLDGPVRQLGSRALKWVAWALFPRRLAKVTDPLSGFFLVHRSALKDCHLRPIGYKILLEILIRCQWRRVGEVPYSFGARRGGESKANWWQIVEFFKHLARLGWDCSPALVRMHRNKGED